MLGGVRFNQRFGIIGKSHVFALILYYDHLGDRNDRNRAGFSVLLAKCYVTGVTRFR